MSKIIFDIQIFSSNLPAGLSWFDNKKGIKVKPSFSGSEIILSDYSSTATKIDAIRLNSSKSVQIVGNAKNNSIVGGHGNDTINGGAGNDTLTGNKGNDVFVYTGGNDVITDYTNDSAESDSIKFVDVEITDTKRGGGRNYNDLIITTSKGTLTIKKGYNKKISIVDSEEYSNSPKNIINLSPKIFISGSDYADTISNKSYAVTIQAGAGNDKIYNSNSNVIISGGKGNDYIKSYGNYATITGGKGKDTIDVNDAYGAVIKYANGDGNDTIYGLGENNILHITKGNYKTKVSGDDVIITVGKGKITLKDVVGEEISIKNSLGRITTEILFAEDNLSEIVADKAVADFENISAEKSTQENLITFAK